MEEVNIFWFRRDLRLYDNSGLSAATHPGQFRGQGAGCLLRIRPTAARAHVAAFQLRCIRQKTPHLLGHCLFVLFADKACFDGVEGELGQFLPGDGVGLGDGEEVVGHVAAEIGGIVGVDGDAQALAQQLDDVVCLHVLEHLQFDVGEGADGQRHAGLGQFPDQGRVFHAAHTVVDALDALAAIYSEIGERLRLLLAH